MTNKQVESEPSKSGQKIPTVDSVLNFIHDRDARLGLVLSVFLLLLLIFVWFSSAYGGISGAGFLALLKAFTTFLVIAICFVVFFKAIDGSMIPKVVIWYFTTLLLVTISVFWAQTILRQPTPLLIESRCFIDLWSQGCPFGSPIAVNIESAPSLGDGAAHGPVSEDGGELNESNIVYVQFAGSLSRLDIISVSEELNSIGWNVQTPHRGGERTAKAVGIDQVRYFHEQDKRIAGQLAANYNEIADWSGFEDLSVAFVPGYESRVSLGHLEVWTSVD